MTKRRNKKYIPHRQPNKVDLDHVSDTSNTTGNPRPAGQHIDTSRETYEEVGIPFQGTVSNNSVITWDEVRGYVKITGIVFTLFTVIVIPIVWHESSIHSSVDVLKNDVKDVKGKTDRLLDSSIKNSQRLDGLEKSVVELNQTLSSQQHTGK